MMGYIEAEVIDKQINKLVEKFPITRENARQWMIFSRVVSSTLDILVMEARKRLRQKGSNGSDSNLHETCSECKKEFYVDPCIEENVVRVIDKEGDRIILISKCPHCGHERRPK